MRLRISRDYASFRMLRINIIRGHDSYPVLLHNPFLNSLHITISKNDLRVPSRETLQNWNCQSAMQISAFSLLSAVSWPFRIPARWSDLTWRERWWPLRTKRKAFTRRMRQMVGPCLHPHESEYCPLFKSWSPILEMMNKNECLSFRHTSLDVLQEIILFFWKVTSWRKCVVLSKGWPRAVRVRLHSSSRWPTANYTHSRMDCTVWLNFYLTKTHP